MKDEDRSPQRARRLLALAGVWGLIHLGPAAAWGQEDLRPGCVVSILNRTSEVQADGTWELPNIPAGFGPVRARATCVIDGLTRSGQSELFTILPNSMNAILPFTLGAVDPVPRQLTLSAPVTQLAAVGATTQLRVDAGYPDGSVRDVTSPTLGTTYTSSNAAIAGVSALGLVTAVSSGTVVISAFNDGTLGLLRVQVILSGDTDGDGISDDIELANGLNPNDPVDALEDFDRDGLSNRQELQLGTQIRNADTDGDTLRDGREVELLTDPLVFDTDGDGLGDGLEVATGSDPRDPASFNLAAALQFIEARPGVVFLVVNTLIGEASRQLQVIGRLIDGRDLNLTSRARGTNYASSNLGVASFGAVDGEVFAGANGTATITVSNSGHSAQVQVNVRSFAPTARSFVAIPGFANNVDVSGDFTFVAAGAAGLQIVNVSDRAAPQIVASLDTPGNANDVRVVGGRAYVADGAAGLQIVDVSNPLGPALLGTADTPGIAQGVAVSGTLVYVADGGAGLQVVDAGNPAAPTLLGGLDTAGTAKGVDAAGGLVVVADGGGGLRVVDVSSPGSPVLLGSLPTTDARDVTLDGSIAYVADYTGSLRVVSLATPSAPQLLATTPGSTGGFLTDVAKVGPFVFGSDVFFVNGVPIVHVGNPAGPVVRARLDFPARDDNGTGIAADARFVYLTAERGITENGTTGDTRLYIGQYLDLSDEAGVPPAVSITAPPPGSEHVEGTTVTVRAQATDDIGVGAVTFSVDGVPSFTDTAAPYEFAFTVPAGATDVTFGATAFDFGGNEGTAPVVTIAVIPDPRTTAAGRVVDRDGNPQGGAAVTCLGLAATSAADGTFEVPGLPTVAGNISCLASVLLPGGVELRGNSASVAPVPAGVTDLGDIVVQEVVFEDQIGSLVASCDDCSVTRTLPFSFPFFGGTYTTVYVNNNGHLTFNGPEGDFTESLGEFNRQPRISAFWDDIIAVGGTTGLYVNDQLPGRFLATWSAQPEFGGGGQNTFQVALFPDGRIRMSYNGMTSRDGIVGITPGPGATLQQVDFSAASPIAVGAGSAVVEQFTVPVPGGSTDPPGSGAGANHPFDMDSHSLLVTPTGGGAYTVTFHTPIPVGNATVEGTVRDAQGAPVPDVEVRVRSSGFPAYGAQATASGAGFYRVTDVPLGMVTVEVVADGRVTHSGHGALGAPGQVLALDAVPVSGSSK